MTRLSDAAIVLLFTVAECMLDGRIRASADEKRLCTGLLQLRDDLDAVTRERDALLHFAGAGLEISRDHGEWDGADLEGALLKGGLLKATPMLVPCVEEGCECLEFYDRGDEAECMRLTDLGRQSLAAPAPTPEGSK